MLLVHFLRSRHVAFLSNISKLSFDSAKSVERGAYCILAEEHDTSRYKLYMWAQCMTMTANVQQSLTIVSDQINCELYPCCPYKPISRRHYLSILSAGLALYARHDTTMWPTKDNFVFNMKCVSCLWPVLHPPGIQLQQSIYIYIYIYSTFLFHHKVLANMNIIHLITS